MKHLAIKAVQVALTLSNPVKRIIVCFVDICICFFASLLAFAVRFDWEVDISQAIAPVLVAMGLSIPLFIIAGFYKTIFRHTGWPKTELVIKTFGLYFSIFALIVGVFGMEGVPRSIGLMQPIFMISGMVLVRWVVTKAINAGSKGDQGASSKERTLIFGAGAAGKSLRALLKDNSRVDIVGFVDDDPALHGRTLSGLPVYPREKLSTIIEYLRVTHVVLAIPSISRASRTQILAYLAQLKLAVRILPSLSRLAEGQITVSDLRNVELSDLLDREVVRPDSVLLKEIAGNKTIMVTGAGGSIGAETCRKLLDLCPATLILLDSSEFALYSICDQLVSQVASAAHIATKVVPLLGSIQDRPRIQQILKEWRPEMIYHSAAYKHVPLVEDNPIEGIKNNIFGTLILAEEAVRAGVSDFVLISSDKAVKPTNIMGATKRVAELILQALQTSEGNNTCFAIVRFGNVLDSSGSVVPKFKSQIERGVAVTVTHPDVTRFFMTISEAVELVIQAGAMAKGGEVFLLDMGQPVKIVDLARKLITLHGLRVRNSDDTEGDIAIEFIGLRPGEKLYEELLIGQKSESTSHERIMKAKEPYVPWRRLERKLSELKRSCELDDIQSGRAILKSLVDGY